MINFRLRENHLTDDTNDYTAVVQHLDTLQIEDLARLIILEGTESDELTIVDLFRKMERMIVRQLAAGKMVDTTLYHAMTTISGRFDGLTAHFDTAKGHRLEIALNICPPALEAIARDNHLVNIGALPVGPVIGTVTDIYTQTEIKTRAANDITTGRGLRIRGEHIRIAWDNEADHATRCGFWFESTTDPDIRIRVANADIQRNLPSEVEIITPLLTPGEYWIEIITQASGKGPKLVKEPRTVRFNTPVKVEAP